VRKLWQVGAGREPLRAGFRSGGPIQTWRDVRKFNVNANVGKPSTSPPLDRSARDEVSMCLQHTLIELVDLGLVGKQRRRTVVGGFTPLAAAELSGSAGEPGQVRCMLEFSR
jgi:hypothetical protein